MRNLQPPTAHTPLKHRPIRHLEHRVNISGVRRWRSHAAHSSSAIFGTAWASAVAGFFFAVGAPAGALAGCGAGPPNTFFFSFCAEPGAFSATREGSVSSRRAGLSSDNAFVHRLAARKARPPLLPPPCVIGMSGAESGLSARARPVCAAPTPVLCQRRGRPSHRRARCLNAHHSLSAR